MTFDLISFIIGMILLGVSATHPNFVSTILSTVFLIIYYVGITERES